MLRTPISDHSSSNQSTSPRLDNQILLLEDDTQTLPNLMDVPQYDAPRTIQPTRRRPYNYYDGALIEKSDGTISTNPYSLKPDDND